MHIRLDQIWPRAAERAVELLPPGALTTPWARLAAAELPPGAIGPSPRGEVVGVLLSGKVEWGSDGVDGPAAAPAVRVGGDVAGAPPRNPGPAPARLLVAAVELPAGASPRPAAMQAVDEAALEWREAIHGGAGRLATRHLWRPEDFASTWTFVDHAVLGPGASVGYHYHDALEEAFAVLVGQGYMTVADQTFEVGPGSVTYQGIGQGHGIYNPGPDNLAFIRLAVALPDEVYTTVDLHDDLRRRRPDPGTGGSP